MTKLTKLITIVIGTVMACGIAVGYAAPEPVASLTCIDCGQEALAQSHENPISYTEYYGIPKLTGLDGDSDSSSRTAYFGTDIRYVHSSNNGLYVVCLNCLEERVTEYKESPHYTITVPASLEANGSGKLTISGTWSVLNEISITANKSVSLQCDLDNSSTVINVDFDDIIKQGEGYDNNISIDGDIRVGELNANFGTWTGNLRFNIEIRKLPGYTIKFDSNNGEGTMPNQVVVRDKSQILNQNKFIREGYEFQGWALTSNGELSYLDQESILNLADENETVTLYAVWALTDVITITNQSQDITISPDESTTFSVEAVGDGLNYQWQRKTAVEETWIDIDGATSNLIIVENIQANESKFRCKIADINGNTVYSDVITLNISPYIVSQPQSITAGPTDTVVFSVEATGDNLSYLWQYRKTTEDSWKSAGGSGSNTDTMTFANATAARNGYQYRCKITDANGFETYSDVVTLTVSPIITVQPVSVTVGSEEPAYFSIEATGGNGELTYLWQFRAAGASKWNTAEGDGYDTSTMSFDLVKTWRHNNQYRCKVTDSDGRIAYSNIVNITVSPYIVTQPQDVVTTADESATFTVEAEGDGLEYLWQYRTSPSGSWRTASGEGYNTYQMTFDPVGNSRNGYQYRCKITDSEGREVTTSLVALTTSLCVKRNPKDVATTSNSSAEFSVEAIGNNLSYLWQYRTPTDETWRAAAGSGKNTDTMIFNPVGNSRNGYQYRCEITDEFGDTVYSDPATLTILNDIIIIEQPVSTTAGKGSTAEFKVEASGTGLTYSWLYKKSGEYVWYYSDADGNNTNTLLVPATESRDGNRYKCAITNSDGITVYSSVVTLTVSQESTLNLEYNEDGTISGYNIS